MGRRRKRGRAISGWVVLDKDYDVGSTESVSRVRRLFDANKAGHAGTLDPLATGILPIALGEATKTVPYVMESEKTYRFTARWGEATDTDDREGDVIATSSIRPERAEIEAILPDFTGEVEQVPPRYSAIKVDGNRAYDLAREGEDVVLQSRTILIHDLTLIDIPDTDHAIFEARTGKGAYVRALVRDIAERLGTKGHISELRRTAVGPFREEDAITLSHIEAHEGANRDALIAGLDLALRDLPSTNLDGQQAVRLQNGQAAILSPAQAKGLRGNHAGGLDAVLAFLHENPVAICALDGLKLKPVRVFQMQS